MFFFAERKQILNLTRIYPKLCKLHQHHTGYLTNTGDYTNVLKRFFKICWFLCEQPWSNTLTLLSLLMNLVCCAANVLKISAYFCLASHSFNFFIIFARKFCFTKMFWIIRRSSRVWLFLNCHFLQSSKVKL